MTATLDSGLLGRTIGPAPGVHLDPISGAASSRCGLEHSAVQGEQRYVVYRARRYAYICRYMTTDGREGQWGPATIGVGTSGLGSGSSRRQIHAIRDLRVAWYQGSPTVDGRTMLAHARVALVLVRARGGRGGRAPYAKCQGALPLSNVGGGGSVGQTRSQHHEAIAIQRVSATTWCFGQMRK